MQTQTQIEFILGLSCKTRIRLDLKKINLKPNLLENVSSPWDIQYI